MMKKTLIANCRYINSLIDNPRTNESAKSCSCFCLWLALVLFTFSLIIPMASPAFAEDDDKSQIIPSPKDFVEKNLKEFIERLEKLKELYREQYGSLFAPTSPTDVEAIEKELPKPTTLTLAVKYPEEKRQEEKKITIEKGDYFLNKISVNAEFDKIYQLTRGYSYGGRGIMLVAADVKTSQLLGLPYKANLTPLGDIHYLSKERTSTRGLEGESCCISVEKYEYCAEYSSLILNKCIRTKLEERCGEYAQPPYFQSLSRKDLMPYKNELNLSGKSVLGATVYGREVTFSSPGKKDVGFVSPRKYSSEEQYKIYRSCIPKYSYRSSEKIDKAVIGYKPAGEISSTVEFTAVEFKKLGFPGYQIDVVHGGQVQKLDYFYYLGSSRDSYSFSHGGPIGKIEPYVLLDYGNAGGLKAVGASEINFPVKWSITKAGPFSIENGIVTYNGGAGDTKFAVTLGGYESVEGSLTANTIEVVLDDAMKRNVVSPGKDHKVRINVKGPADMTRYQVKWTGDGGAWAQSVTPFRKVGEIWQAEGSFSVGFDGASKLGQPAKIKAEVVMIAGSNKVYTYESSKLATTYPAVDKLELYAGVGDSAPEKVTEPIDLFSSLDTPRVVLSPRLSLKGGEFYTLDQINPQAGVEITSSNPAIVNVIREPVVSSGMLNIVAHAGGKTGNAKVVAKIGGKDLDPLGYAQIADDRTELESNVVEISVNDAYLIAKSLGGRTIYKLIVSGPADMTKYQARWTGEANRETSFKSDSGVFVSMLDTTLRMDKVIIQKAGKAFAQFDVKSASRKLNITLIPPKPPVTIVSKVNVSDLGSLETITECKKNVGRQIEAFGFNPGMAVEDYCKAEREKQKQEIKAEREEQKAFNKMLRDLNKQGQDLVIVSDTMRVGAAIKGDTTFINEVFCFWSLENKENLELQSAVTPVEKVGFEEGACFNTVKGLKSGFNPETMIKVDLVLPPRPDVPVVATGENVFIYGNISNR
ncbi:MAG TPA: hypothetical protein PKH70_07880 [Syntrophorhabdaceae bacterium]|nr:hypothetical protein [Syntrophorhabdaceae bacterium]